MFACPTIERESCERGMSKIRAVSIMPVWAGGFGEKLEGQASPALHHVLPRLEVRKNVGLLYVLGCKVKAQLFSN